MSLFVCTKNGMFLFGKRHMYVFLKGGYPMKSVWFVLVLYVSCSQAVLAQDATLKTYYDMPYAQARPLLIEAGWQVVPNKRIQDSSMFAQSVHASQFEEVLDCISMERDQCQFVLAKGKKLLLVTTKDKTLAIETMKEMKK